MKKIMLFIIIFLFSLNSVNAKELDINAENYLLYHLDNNKIVLENNIDMNVKIASLTKIMTVLIMLEEIDNLQDTITIKSEMLNGLKEAQASVVGFSAGEKVTYEDLLMGSLLPSGADATRAIAISLYGNEESFAKVMNKKAQELGMNNTHFTNSTGLDDAKQKATLKDILKLMLYALDNKTFKRAFESNTYISSTNRIMQKTLDKTMITYDLNFEYLKGSKTGFTTPAGLCLISTASNNENYLLITTGSRYESTYRPLHLLDAINIYSYYFHNFKNVTILKKGELLQEIDVRYSNKKTIKFYAHEEIKELLNKEDVIESYYEGLKYLKPGLKPGYCLGTYYIEINDMVYQEIDLCLEETISFSLVAFLNHHFYLYIILIIIVIIIIWKTSRRKIL